MNETLKLIIEGNIERAVKGDPDAVNAVIRAVELQARIHAGRV